MHTELPKVYYFINKFDKNNINKLNKNIALIYRNYNKKLDKDLIIKIKKYCKLKKRKFFLANNVKLALNLKIDGAYLPSFNNNLKHLNYPKRKNFFIIGSAHNYKEIKKKELQKVDIIFIASLFSRKKTYLGFNKFKLLTKLTKKKIIALGGINKNNLKKINLLNIYGYSGINLFNK
jgi:thiamine-phosphate pyrophosphorylase